jgi:hypothetical protein
MRNPRYPSPNPGKHKDHDVKTLRKSQPLIKAEVDKLIEQFDSNTEKLMVRKS